jgi:methylmalonyl-CoA mutase cobalamin-binding subunit
VIAELKKYGREDIMVVVGGVIHRIINSYLMPEL